MRRRSTRCTDTTVFVSTIGDQPNFRECLAHLERQTLQCPVQIIDHVAPMSAAFQRMLDRCRTPYYVQVDEDMLLFPHALETLRTRIGNAPAHIALVCALLWDCDIEAPVEGVKIFRHAIVRQFPYEDSVSCELTQLDRLQAAGYDLDRDPPGDRSLCLGEHGKHYHPASIFARWQRLFQKQRRRGHLAWLDAWPRRLLNRYLRTRDPVHLYGFLGALAGVTGELAPDEEIDWRIPNPAYERLSRLFPLTPRPAAAVPQATIVILLRREKDAWLRRAVRSAVTQTVPCHVVVVAEQETPRSNLDTLATIEREFGNLRVVFRPPPANRAAALNFGVQAATTARVGLLRSDHWLSPRCLELSLRRSADIVSAGDRPYRANGRTPVRRALSAMDSIEEQVRHLGPFLLLRRSAIIKAGYFDESTGDVPGLAEQTLLRSLLERGTSVALVAERLYHTRPQSSAPPRSYLGSRSGGTATSRIALRHTVAGRQ